MWYTFRELGGDKMYDMTRNGRKLVELRGKKSQATVAEAVGISVSALAMYESGARNPRDDVKLALANYYGVSVASLFFSQEVH